MKKFLVDAIMGELNSLATTKQPVLAEVFIERIGKKLFDRLVVKAGSTKPGIREAEKRGHVFFNGIDQKNLPSRLAKMELSFEETW